MYRRTYEWDDKNQLIKSQDDNVTVCYTYGSDGQRASKYTENSETLYTNDFWVFHVSGSVRNGAGIINKNIYLGKMRVVTKVKEAYDAMEITERQCQYFYHSDHLGSAQLVTDNKGNEYQRIEYTPYGETWIDLKATQNDLVKLNYKFTAKELDEETGLYYYGARYLDPKYSMWISTDPALGEYIPQAPVNDEIRKNNQNLPGMGGIFNHINSNLYHYAGNNPVKYVDPDGREDELSYLEKQNEIARYRTNINTFDFYMNESLKLSVEIGELQKEIGELKNENFNIAIDYAVQTVNDVLNLFSIFGEAANLASQQSYDVYSFCVNFTLNIDVQNLAESVSDYKNENRLTHNKVEQIMQKNNEQIHRLNKQIKGMNATLRSYEKEKEKIKNEMFGK